MNRALMTRLVREQRVRLPLEVLLIGLWGFLLVAVFATSEVFTKQLEAQAKQFGGLLDLVGLDPLAQWASIGFQHPIFLLGGGLFAVGLSVRAIAGELEAGSLALALSRPLARRTWFLSHLVVLIVGCLIIGEAYALGCLLAVALTDPMGHLESVSMLLAGLQSALLLLSLVGIGFVISAFSSERGRAL